MLSSLPPELLRNIIESTVPHSFHQGTYSERQTTLCSLSLVSRQFYAIAQPLLKEVIWIEFPGQLDSLRFDEGDRTCARRFRIGWLVVNGNINVFREPEDQSSPEPSRLRTLGRILSLADAITLDMARRNFNDFAWTHLVSNANLTYLHLFDWFERSPTTSALTNLRSLALTHASFTLIKSILNPKLLPRLQNFAFEGEEVAALRDSKLDAMLPQLETLTFDYSRWSDPRLAFLHSAANKTLVNVLADQLADVTIQPVPVTHMRLESIDYQSGDSTQRSVPDLVTFVRDPRCRLRSIYLPSSFTPTLSELSVDAATSISILFDACRAHDVDVVIEEGPEEWYDPLVSPEFVHRQRAARIRSMEASTAGDN
ncbi:hypothetical protein JCM3766R1_005047 [Sporobolomyces carnicolor]